MNKAIFASAVGLLLTVGLVLWLLRPPPDGGWSQGHAVGSLSLPVEFASDTLVQALQENGFERVEGRTFAEIVPGDRDSSSYEGLIALRDTTAEDPYEFVLGVGSDVVVWFKSHSGSSDSAKSWEEHVEKRLDLVKRLMSNMK